MSRVACLTREDRDAVVRRLSEELALVTAFLKKQCGKLVIRALCFLHAEDVGLHAIEPTHDVRQACED